MNEVEDDIENHQGRGSRYPLKPKAVVDNTNRGLDNSRYHAKSEFNNCFIMYSKPKNKEQNKWNTLFTLKQYLVLAEILASYRPC